jgi:hypothetical protein
MQRLSVTTLSALLLMAGRLRVTMVLTLLLAGVVVK